MKSIAVLLMSLALVLPAMGDKAFRDAAHETANRCKEETGATDEDVHAMMSHQPAGSREAKCMRACFQKSFKFMTEEGKLDRETMLELLKLLAKGDEDKLTMATEIIDACIDMELPEDHCDAVFEFEQCMAAKATEKGISFKEMISETMDE